jgi:hypothetical protein
MVELFSCERTERLAERAKAFYVPSMLLIKMFFLHSSVVHKWSTDE